MQLAGKGKTPSTAKSRVTIPLVRRNEVTNFGEISGSTGNPVLSGVRPQRVAIRQQNALVRAKIGAQLKYWQDRLTTLAKVYFPVGGADARFSRALFVFNGALSVQLWFNANAFGPIKLLDSYDDLSWVYAVAFGFTASLHLASSMHWPKLSLSGTMALRRSAYTASIIVTLGWMLLYLTAGTQLGGIYGALYPWLFILYVKLGAFKQSVPKSDKRSRAQLRKELRRDRG